MTQQEWLYFWDNVQKTESCWLWRGWITPDGYGRFEIAQKRFHAHRFAYEMCVSQIPIGLTIDHLCRVRSCVNPRHLEPVPNKTNVLRGNGITAQNSRKTHCKEGHLLLGENLQIRRTGRRRCLTCHRRHNAEWRLRHPAQGTLKEDLGF